MTTRTSFIVAAFVALPLVSAAPRAAGAPVIDNDRVTVWDGMSAAVSPAIDAVWVSLTQPGMAVYRPAGAKSPVIPEGRNVVIALKDLRVPSEENKSGYPDAFRTRPGIKKVLENDRVAVWDYTWTPGVPTFMHFHTNDVVVVYVETGELMSTTVDGQRAPNDFSFGTIKFNARNRVHTETLVRGKARAIITELK